MNLAAKSPEEVAQQRRALHGQQAGHDLDPVVEPAVVEDPIERADRARLGVVAAEVEAADARVDQRARRTSGTAPS